MSRLVDCRWWIALVALFAVSGAIATPGAQAEIVGVESEYTLEEGETFDDDLTVFGERIIIDGTIEGDLIAAAKYIEINGTVTGDVIAAGYGIKVTGTVGDDARLGGAAVEVSGTIGDSLYATGGGGEAAPPIQSLRTDKVDEGLLLTDTASVGGDVAIAGGEVRLEGAIEGEALIAAGDLTLVGSVGQDAEVFCKEFAVEEGAQIGGNLSVKSSSLTLAGSVGQDAEVFCKEFEAEEGAKIAGKLSVRSPEELEIPEDIAASVEFEQIETQASKDAGIVGQIVGRVIGGLANIVGFIVLGLVFSRFGSKAVARPASAMAKKPLWAALYGLPVLLAFTLVPVATCLLLVLSVLQGIETSLAIAGLVVSLMILMWNLSPAITGLWLGRKLAGAPHDDTVSLRTFVLGASILVVLGQIPYIGVVVYLFSMLAAIGGIFLASRMRPEGESVAVEPTQEPAEAGPDTQI